VAPKSYIPISFYRDYLLQCVVRERINPRTTHYQQVSRSILQDIQFSPNLYLDYRVSAKEARRFDIKDVYPEIYGRIYKDVLSTDKLNIPVIFLPDQSFMNPPFVTVSMLNVNPFAFFL